MTNREQAEGTNEMALMIRILTFGWAALAIGGLAILGSARAGEPRPLFDEPPWHYEGLYLSPLPDEILVGRYGSARPGPGTVLGDSTLDGIANSDGRYVITYQDGQPATVVFFGMSSW